VLLLVVVLLVIFFIKLSGFFLVFLIFCRFDEMRREIGREFENMFKNIEAKAFCDLPFTSNRVLVNRIPKIQLIIND
jgi:hypothetical protein